ncbi:SDR family oxidoreductase [Amycolatopsis sp. H20-H5]|uniref:SDR family oxidoreductase n=1 Tax=Amycolatopsis sp. H20-H5 TaxID=3046309 RepID=UPI002DC0206E|nr:NAD(P)H-binding protein [Amycolatopsis sp. H20-H5]MEC3975520.1 NAD(P)H-binding protein [Amycolatopsis sp. H20-H5]
MPTSSHTILVIGPTGNVGPHALTQLLGAGVTARALVRPGDPAADRVPAGVEIFSGDLADPESLVPALRGVTGVFLMWPFFTLDVTTVPQVLEVISRYTKRIAFVSSIGVHIGLEPVDNNCHAYLEQQIEKADLTWTFLQTTGFACNAAGWARQIADGDSVRFPYGAAVRSPIHEGDVAAVAVRALTEQGHENRRYVVTGPEQLAQAEQLGIIGEVLGRKLKWIELPHGAARGTMVESGWPPAYADGALDYFAALTEQPETRTDTVAEVLGRSARTFRSWVSENASLFQ